MDQLTINVVGGDKPYPKVVEGDKPNPKGQQNATLKIVDHTINGKATAAIWLFGILEGKSIEQLVDSSAISLDISDLATQATNELFGVPSPGTLSAALALGDFYVILFFPRLMTEVLWKMARRGKFFALACFTVAIQLEELELSRFAVKHMTGLPCPVDLDKTTVRAIGTDAWWCLVTGWAGSGASSRQAKAPRVYYSESPSGHTQWTGTADNWKSVAKAIRFE